MATFEVFENKYKEVHKGRHEIIAEILGTLSREDKRKDLETLYANRKDNLSDEEKEKHDNLLVVFPDADGLKVFDPNLPDARAARFDALSDDQKDKLIENVDKYIEKRGNFRGLEDYLQHEYAVNFLTDADYQPFATILNIPYAKDLANSIYELPEMTEEKYKECKDGIKKHIENAEDANEIAENLGVEAFGPGLENQKVSLPDEIKNLFENGRLKKSVSQDDLSKAMDTLRDYQKAVGALGAGKFTGPVGTGESKDINPQSFETESARYNGPWISTARSVRNSHKATHETRYGKYAGWARDGEHPKLVWHDYSPVASITGSSNILTDILDLGFSVAGNAINAATFFQGRKWLSEYKNRSKAMIEFAKTYMKDEYRKYFGKKVPKLEANPESLQSLIWIRGFFKSKKDKYRNLEGFNHIAGEIKKQHKNDLNGKAVAKDFETWAFLGRRFYNDSWFSRNLGFTVAGRLFEKDDIKMQRRSIQYAQGGGNYIGQMKKSVQTSRELIEFLEKNNPDLLADPKLDLIRVSIKELEKAGKNSFDGVDQYILQNRVFDAIQNANLRHKKNHPLVQKIVDTIQREVGKETKEEIKKIQAEIDVIENDPTLSEAEKKEKRVEPNKEMLEQREKILEQKTTALRKMNFLVGNISRKRVEWYDVWSRVFPDMYDTSREENDGMRLSKILNKPLILEDYKGSVSEESLVKQVVEDIKELFDKLQEGETTKLPFAPEGWRQKLEKRFGFGPKAKEVKVPKLDFEKGKLTAKSRKEFKAFLEKVQKEQGFKKRLNTGVVRVEPKIEGDEVRHYIKLDDALLRKISYVYTIITDKQPADNIDEVDKVIVEKETNKIIKELSQEEYARLVKQKEKYGDVQNLPFYIALERMNFAIKTIQEEVGKYSDTLNPTYKSAFDMAIKETEYVEALLDELRKKGSEKYLFQTNTSFADSYEERLRNLKEVMNLYDNVLQRKEAEKVNGKDEKKEKNKIIKNINIINTGLESKELIDGAISVLENHEKWIEELENGLEEGAVLPKEDRDLQESIKETLGKCYALDVEQKTAQVSIEDNELDEAKEKYDLDENTIENLKVVFEKTVQKIDKIKSQYDAKNKAYTKLSEAIESFETEIKKDVAEIIQKKKKEAAEKIAHKGKIRKRRLSEILTTSEAKWAALRTRIMEALRNEEEKDFAGLDKEATAFEILILALEEKLNEAGMSLEEKVRLGRLKKNAESTSVHQLKKELEMKAGTEVLKEEVKQQKAKVQKVQLVDQYGRPI
ncbi:MAG: hypothetical protein JW812_01350 [Alphaproteobacteria bacterium]|nr:hypothetical protein [Alphaproteobacteria bacterium]MBN2779769.1 hypothetical protein [Alphaproteobacteria bacterium]